MYIKYNDLLALRYTNKVVNNQLYSTEKGIYVGTSSKTFKLYSNISTSQDSLITEEGKYIEYTYDSEGNITTKKVYVDKLNKKLLKIVTFLYSTNKDLVKTVTTIIGNTTSENKELVYSSDGNLININNT